MNGHKIGKKGFSDKFYHVCTERNFGNGFFDSLTKIFRTICDDNFS